MPLPDITIIRRHVRVNAGDPIRTGNDDDGLERNEEVGRGHPDLPVRDIARSEDGRNDSRSNENRVRNCYRHVPVISPSSNRYDRHSPRQQTESTSTFHTPSRQPPSREQNDQRRQPSYRLERYENIVYTTTSDQSDQSREPSYRLERYERTVYTTSSRQALPEEPSDQTRHFGHRTEWSENTTNSPRQASPQREPTHQGRNFSHRTEWSENTTNSPRQAPPPREPTHQTRNFSHHTRQRSDHTPHHQHHSPRQAPPTPSSRERAQQQSEYYSFNNPQTSTTPPVVAPRGGGGGGDLYKILKVSPEASQAEIVNAARRRRIEVHPDRLRQQYAAGGMTQAALDAIDEEARNVGLAADTLCDEVSRRSYDRAVRRGSRS